MTTRGLIPAIALATMIIASCAPATTPGPSAAPEKPATSSPAVAPSKAAESPAAAQKPSTSPAAQPAASADWQAEWNKVLAAAKTEGKVVVAGAVGPGYREAAMPFTKAFPDIQLEFSGVDGTELAAKISPEREAGTYLWDVHIGGPTTGLSVLKPKGIIDPVRPVMLLPEVVDDTKWVGGLDSVWKDVEGKFMFAFESRLVPPVWINRDLVPESELGTIDQLLDPKWKGKIVTRDPRLSGTSSAAGSYLLIVKGEDWVRKLYSQGLVLNNDERAAIESVVRGVYPIAMGVNQSNIESFQREGLGKNIKPLDPDPDNKLGQYVTSARGNLMLINKAPHPNAAKVFINWLLTKDGQKAYVENTGLNSRRTDVDGPASSAPKKGVKIVDADSEANLSFNKRGKEIATEIIK